MRIAFIGSLLMFFIIGACTPFRPDVRTAPEGNIPDKFSLFSERLEQPGKWWEDFNDQELNNLIDEALSDSLTIAQAWSRLRQSNSLLVQKGAGLYPTLNFSTSGSYIRQKITTEPGTTQTAAGPGAGAATTTSNQYHKSTESYSFGLSSSYELDLWGRIGSDKEASRLDVMASREDLNTIAISLAAQVTENWINIITQRLRKKVLEEQLNLNKTYLEVVELRFRKNMVSALDVYQQRQVVAQIEAQIPLVEAQEQLLLHGLAILLGKPPKYPIKISREELPIPENVPSTGIPADLLANRPDVRAAGIRLESADWRVSIAKANRLPVLSLSAGGSYSANKIDLVLDNWILNLAANIVAPVIDGGRRAAEVERTKEVVNERLLKYRETVLGAIKEVEDALVREQKQREHIKAVELQLSVSQSALEEAIARYRKGLNQYLPVLTQIISVQSLEQDLVQKKAQLITYRVNLYRALGGTWPEQLNPNNALPVASAK